MNKSIVLISLYDTAVLGVRNLHGVLKNNGFESNIIFFKEPLLNKFREPSETEINLLINKIRDINPNIIAMSVTSPLFRIAKILTTRLKHLKKPVIWGGIHPTIEPEQCIKHTDIICLGEGEKSLLELMKNENNDTINNLWIKQGKNIKKNPLNNLNQDLDSLSFPDISNKNKYYVNENKLTADDVMLRYGTYLTITGRGCPFSCSYCVNSFLHKFYKGKGRFMRRRSVDNVIDELATAKNKLEIKRIYFYDEIFTLDKHWLEQFVRAYKEKIDLPFGVNLHSAVVTDDSIRKLKEAGLYKITLGIQTGSERIRKDIFNRHESDKQILNAINILRKYNIKPSYDVIIDNPYETKKDMEDSLLFLLKIKRPYIIHLYSLINFPKTQLTEKIIKDKLGVENSEIGYAYRDLTRTRKERTEENTIYNSKVSLLSKSFVPKYLIKQVRSKRTILILAKIVNNLNLMFIGLRLLFTGKLNFALLKYYVRSYKGTVN